MGALIKFASVLGFPCLASFCFLLLIHPGSVSITQHFPMKPSLSAGLLLGNLT